MGNAKGLDVFIELSKRLDKNKFQIVLVGTDDSIDKMLPNSIISIHRTRDQNELAEIYSAADLFVNPTREEKTSMETTEKNMEHGEHFNESIVNEVFLEDMKKTKYK